MHNLPCLRHGGVLWLLWPPRPRAIQICFDVWAIHQMWLWGPRPGRRGTDLGPETVEITILILETNCASCHSSHQLGVQHSNLKILVFFFIWHFYNTPSYINTNFILSRMVGWEGWVTEGAGNVATPEQALAPLHTRDTQLSKWHSRVRAK